VIIVIKFDLILGNWGDLDSRRIQKVDLVLVPLRAGNSWKLPPGGNLSYDEYAILPV
jgi:hypothetical protein